MLIKLWRSLVPLGWVNPRAVLSPEEGEHLMGCLRFLISLEQPGFVGLVNEKLWEGLSSCPKPHTCFRVSVYSKRSLQLGLLCIFLSLFGGFEVVWVFLLTKLVQEVISSSTPMPAAFPGSRWTFPCTTLQKIPISLSGASKGAGDSGVPLFVSPEELPWEPLCPALANFGNGVRGISNPTAFESIHWQPACSYLTFPQPQPISRMQSR